MEDKLKMLLSIDSNTLVYNDLKEQYQNKKVIPFFGAGISYCIYPCWIELLEKLAEIKGSGYCSKDEFCDELKQNGAEKVACKLKKNLEENYREAIIKIFSPDKLKPESKLLSGWRRVITEVFHGPILTTNYDKTIEGLYQGKIERHIVNDDSTINGFLMAKNKLRNQLSLFKLHGCIDAPKSIILDSIDYKKAYEKSSQVVEQLSDFLKGTYVLFIGCSLEQDRTIKILKRIYEKRDIQHFAFVELPKETENTKDPYQPSLVDGHNNFLPEFKQRKHLLNTVNGLRCIWFPYGRFDDICVLLKGLIDITEDTSNFIGRKEEIQTLTNELLKTYIDKMILIHGGNGSGKTELCERFLASCGCKYITINCEIISTYNGLLSLLTKAFNCNDDIREPERVILNKINETIVSNEPVILYFDNLDALLCSQEASKFEIFIQQVSPNKNVRLLATTTFLPDKNIISNYAKPISLNDLNDGDASRLFVKKWNERHSNQIDKYVTTEQVSDFVKVELGSHAMSIELCCSYSIGFSFEGFIEHWNREATNIIAGGDSTSFCRSFNYQWEFFYKHELGKDFMIVWHIFYYTSSSIKEDEIYKIIGCSNHWKRVIREMIYSWIISRDDGVLFMKPFYKYQLSILQQYKEKMVQYSTTASKMLLDYYLDIVNGAIYDWALFIKKLPDILYYMSVISNYEEPEFTDHIRKIYFQCKYHFHHVTIAACDILEKLYSHLEQKKNVSDLLSDIRFRIGQLKFYLCDNREALADYDKASGIIEKPDEKSKAIFNLYRAEILLYETGTMQLGRDLLKSAYAVLKDCDCVDTARAKRLYVSKIMRKAIESKKKNDFSECELTQYQVDGEHELEEAMNICLKENNYFELCYVLRNWGEWLIVCSKLISSKKELFYDRAIEKYRNCIYYADKYSFKYHLAHLLLASGEIYKIRNLLDAALADFERAYSSYEELCEYQGQGHAIKDQADIYTLRYNGGETLVYETALQKYTKAIDLYKKAKDDRGKGYAYLYRSILRGKKYKREAIDDVLIAINIFRSGQLNNDETKAIKWLRKLEGEE